MDLEFSDGMCFCGCSWGLLALRFLLRVFCFIGLIKLYLDGVLDWTFEFPVTLDCLSRPVPIPEAFIVSFTFSYINSWRASTHHGKRTDQLRKMAAKTNNVTSVTKTLPFWKKTPAIAGSSASANGAECQSDSSVATGSSLSLAIRGRKISSVEDLIELRASDSESENVELRRCGQLPSTKVAAREGKPRRRRLEADEVPGERTGEGGSAIVKHLQKSYYRYI